jgi:hypothetical protein
VSKAAAGIRLHTRTRLEQAIEEVRRSMTADFPYDDPKEALEIISDNLRASLRKLTDAVDEKELDVRAQHALETVSKFYRHLGLLSRCTSVVNPFELHSPLLRLTGALLQQPARETRLVLSTEWNDMPFVFKHSLELDQFVFIGLPATESSNPLVSALAGHELGHCVWRRKGIHKSGDSLVKRETTRYMVKHEKELTVFLKKSGKGDGAGLKEAILQFQSEIENWARSQIEELFCDIMGVRLFGEAYLHSFAYWLTPKMPGQRPPSYPSLKARVDCIKSAARKFKVTVPAGYSEFFNMAKSNDGTPADFAFKLTAADTVSTKLVRDLVLLVKNHCTTAKVDPLPSLKDVSSIVKDFKRCIPSDDAQSLAAIFCAGWKAYCEKNFWDDQDGGSRKIDQIADLVLKSAELLEIRNLQRDLA